MYKRQRLHAGLVGDDADGLAGDAAETDNDVLGEAILYFEEIGKVY